MRNLDRDRTPVWVCRYKGIEAVEDEHGRLTGRNRVAYEDPCKFYPTASAARGDAVGSAFGMQLDYDRTLTIDDRDFRISEADVLYIDNAPGDDGSVPYDHIVKKVARTANFCVVAVKRVEVSK